MLLSTTYGGHRLRLFLGYTDYPPGGGYAAQQYMGSPLVQVSTRTIILSPLTDASVIVTCPHCSYRGPTVVDKVSSPRQYRRIFPSVFSFLSVHFQRMTDLTPFPYLYSVMQRGLACLPGLWALFSRSICCSQASDGHFLHSSYVGLANKCHAVATVSFLSQPHLLAPLFRMLH
jgi:hypothetical protein